MVDGAPCPLRRLHNKTLQEITPGDKFSHWTVLYELPKVGASLRYYMCRCDCGKEVPVYRGSLLRKRSSQCLKCAGRAGRQNVEISAFKNFLRHVKRTKWKQNLSFRQFKKLWRQTTCHYCGIAIQHPELGSKITACYIDRKDSTKGYTPSNVVTCCPLCNKTKNNTFTYDEYMKLAPALTQIQYERRRH